MLDLGTTRFEEDFQIGGAPYIETTATHATDSCNQFLSTEHFSANDADP